MTKNFIPPYPSPREHQPNVLKVLYYLRKDPMKLLTKDLQSCAVVEKRLFGKRALFVNDGELTRYFFSRARDIYTIDPIRKLLLKPGFGNGLACVDGEDWQKNRTLTKQYFTGDYLAIYSEKFFNSANSVLHSLEDGRSVNLHSMFSEAAFQSAHSCFFSSVDPDTVNSMANSYNRVMTNQMTIDVADIFLLPTFVPRLLKLGANGPLRACRQIARSIVADGIKNRGNVQRQQNLLDGYISAYGKQDKCRSKDRRKIEDNVGTMLGAGFETTSLTMTWAVYFLLNSDYWMGRVREELSYFEPEARDKHEWPKALPTIQAVLHETLRVYPILPAIVRHATKNDDVSGFEVREGDFIVANLWAMHRNERYWPNPTEFAPERFLDQPAISQNKSAYFPFGLGTRGCIGAQFAMIEAVIVLATLFMRFDLKLASADPVHPTWRGTLRPSKPVIAKIVRRSNPRRHVVS